MISRVLFALMFTPLFALCAPSTTGPIRCVRDLVADLNSGKSSESAFELPVTVSYVGPSETTFFVTICDSSGETTVYLPTDLFRQSSGLAPGDKVICSGVARGNALPVRTAILDNLRRIGRDLAPSPSEVSSSLLAGGSFDLRHVRIRGTVWDARNSETNPRWGLLTIADKTGIALVSIRFDPDDRPALDILVGSDIQLDGVCFPRELGNGVRKHLGRTIKSFGMKSIRLLSPTDQGKCKTPEITALENARAEEIPRLQRHSAVGTVVAAWGRHVLLTTTNNTLVSVNLIRGTMPHPGQQVRAVGFPETDLLHLILTKSVLEELGPAPLQANLKPTENPIVITNSSSLAIIRQRLFGKTVRIIGSVITIPQQSENLMYIKHGNNLIPVYLSQFRHDDHQLEVGCRIEVTGICILDAEHWPSGHIYPKIKGFFVATRSGDDVRVIDRPPWWTPHRLLIVISSLLLFLLIIAIWNHALRRTAARKGYELMREQLRHVKAELKTEERTRLAVELHDSLAQNLTGVSLEIDTANKLAEEDQVAMRTHLNVAARTLKSCRDELRNCLWDLRSRALETPTMDAAIRQTLAPHSAGIDLAIRFDVPRDRISDNTAHAILCIIRELTLNGIRHGHASKIKIAGCIEDDRMLFSVQDNGCGFCLDSAPGFQEGHYGLIGIQERVNKFEGEFKISRGPGKGTKATVTLAVPQEA